MMIVGSRFKGFLKPKETFVLARSFTRTISRNIYDTFLPEVY
jgi:hypothetical protein